VALPPPPKSKMSSGCGTAFLIRGADMAFDKDLRSLMRSLRKESTLLSAGAVPALGFLNACRFGPAPHLS